MYANTPLKRYETFISRLLTEKESAKEIKIFGLGAHLITRWSKSYMKNANKTLGLLKKEQYTEFGVEGIKTLFYLAITYMIIKLIRQDNLKIGDYVAVLQAVQQVQSKLYQTSNSIALILEDSLYLRDFFSFIEFNEHAYRTNHGKDSFPIPLVHGIELRNINFSYEKQSNPILQDISLLIKPGEKIAIVGENGCGKSTLVKCLMGLYPVNSGKILFDNIPIIDIKEEEVHKNITVLFQNFTRFPFSVYDNIAFGNISLLNDKKGIEELSMKTRVNDFVKNLKDGYDTKLTKLLQDGIDLSGGQWQKIAYTRALFRNSQVIILDEPTASMDPQSEKEVFEQFNNIAENKTLIFISHRMSATKIADRIIVMKKGQIYEMGTFLAD